MEQGRESRRVLVVDEHPIVANAIRHVLAGLDDRVAVTVCHDAGSALEVFHLRAVLDGERVFPATIPRAGIRLTRRQRNILLLLGRGHSTKEIAAMLDLAVGTVDNHIANAMQALTVRNRTHAIFRAIALGLIDASEVIESGCDRGGERSGMCVGAVVSAGVEP
ncbi:Response regulator [Burkholderia multivorans]